MYENLIIYGAVYDDVRKAVADLESFEKLNKRELVGQYDAAVIEQHNGLPHLVRRMAHPTLELIPELVARGKPPIGVLAEPLRPGEPALAVVGSPELEKAFAHAVRSARMTSVRQLRRSELALITQSA